MTAISTDDSIDTEGSTTTIVPAGDALPARAVDTDRRTIPTTDVASIETPIPGAGLVAEAELAVHERRWRDALRVLGAIDSIGANSVHTDGLLAIAATHLNKKRTADEALGRIRAHPRTAASHRHLAEVAIIRHQYLLGDQETRAAMALVETEPDLEPASRDWSNLAACYAGLGWFDEASDCLDRARALGADESETWLVGRSTNQWGLSRNWAAAVGICLFLIVGLLALAVAITVPFMAREFRLTQLDERFAALANDAWADERWLRLAHAAAVLITVVAWSVAMQMS